MARTPADEDYARALLSIFKARKIRAGQSIRHSEAEAAFLGQNMGRPADFEAALRYAASRRWLAPALDTIRLLPPGDEVMHSVGFP